MRELLLLGDIDVAGGSWLSRLVWGSPAWILPALIGAAVLFTAVAWCYRRGGGTWGVRAAAASLKAAAITAVAICICEPLWLAVRPRPGANLFLVVADNSESLAVRDQAAARTRGERLRSLLVDQAPWLVRLGQDFEVRRYLVDSQLRPTETFQALTSRGDRSSLATALSSIARQYRDRPVAGVLLLTDGNATDWDEASFDFENVPPVYPVPMGEDGPPRDVVVTRVAISQTNFESLPVTIHAETAATGLGTEEMVLQLMDESGQEVQRHEMKAPPEGKTFSHSFQLRPERAGVSFYTVRAAAKSEESLLASGKPGREATFANNTRVAMIDRGRGPYRVLYVSGRPNWEFKFLRRAVQEDDEIELVGIVRIARKEPKFTFRGRAGESTNPLFRGFGNQTDDTAEQFDQPVLVRIGTRDQEELRDGFPKTAEDLFEYHAIILDDLESSFFTRDQMGLIQQFVSQRGGALMMLGGQESFGGGDYARTPIGDLLPVYVDRPRPSPPSGEYRLALTREGWLQSWVRLRSTEVDEKRRLAGMPGFRAWNATSSLKPGATVLMHAAREGNDEPRGAEAMPALAVQRFGSGQVAALLVGDLWRWDMRRESSRDSDLAQTWRQMIRWLVSNVPRRVEVETRRKTETAGQGVEFRVVVRDESYLPMNNALVTCDIAAPEGKSLSLRATPTNDLPGTYSCVYAPRVAGSYRIAVSAIAEDQSVIGTSETGMTHEPAMEEFRSVRPNRELLQRIAEQTGGEVVDPNQLDRFVSSMPNRPIPITEPWISPLWHQWPVVGLAIFCLVGEWGLRRWKGLP